MHIKTSRLYRKYCLDLDLTKSIYDRRSVGGLGRNTCVDKSSKLKMLVFGVVWLQLLFRDHYLSGQSGTMMIFTLKCDKNNDDEDMDVLQNVGVTLSTISFDHNSNEDDANFL